MMKKIYLLMTVLVLSSAVYQSLQAQDFTFSQYFANKVYLNPAFAGTEYSFNSSANHRMQYINTPNGPWSFQASQFNVDFQFPKKSSEMARQQRINQGKSTTSGNPNDIKKRVIRGRSKKALSNKKKAKKQLERQRVKTVAENGVTLGGAVSFFTDNQGEGRLRTYQPRLTLAGQINEQTSNQFLHQFSFGLTAGYISRRINWDDLYFSDQLDPVLGLVNSQSQAHTIANGFQPRSYLDFDAGLLYRLTFLQSLRMISIGYSPKHLFNPSNTTLLENGNDELLTRHLIHIMYYEPFPTGMVLSFGTITEFQGMFRTTNIGGNVALRNNIYGGIWYRHNLGSEEQLTGASTFALRSESLIFTAGVAGKIPQLIDRNQLASGLWMWQLGVSYDANIGRLDQTSSAGTFEISLTIQRRATRACPQDARGNPLGYFLFY